MSGYCMPDVLINTNRFENDSKFLNLIWVHVIFSISLRLKEFFIQFNDIKIRILVYAFLQSFRTAWYHRPHYFIASGDDNILFFKVDFQNVYVFHVTSVVQYFNHLIFTLSHSDSIMPLQYIIANSISSFYYESFKESGRT